MRRRILGRETLPLLRRRMVGRETLPLLRRRMVGRETLPLLLYLAVFTQGKQKTFRVRIELSDEIVSSSTNNFVDEDDRP